MRAVLLFSALLHIVAVGALAAFALRSWLNANRTKEPSTGEFVSAATVLGLLVAVAGTIIAWMGRPFGPALTTGLVAGLLAALAFMLGLGRCRTGGRGRRCRASMRGCRHSGWRRR